jgi:hypothetical protein
MARDINQKLLLTLKTSRRLAEAETGSIVSDVHDLI